MGLCFRFVITTVLITQGYFSYCWTVLTQCQGLFCSSHRPTSEQAGGAQEAGRGHSWDSWPSWLKGYLIPSDITLSNKNRGGRRRKGRTFEVMVFCLPKQSLHVMEPCFPGDGWTPACRWEAVNEFPILLCLVLAAFALPVKLSLTQRTSFLTFTLLILSPIPLGRGGGEWANRCVLLSSLLPHKSKASAQNLSSIMHVSSSRSVVKTFFIWFRNAQHHILDSCLHTPCFLMNWTQTEEKAATNRR